MSWYFLNTWAGKEEALVKEIHRIIPPYWYKDCFVMYQERIWRRQQRSIVHREQLFPGYVFLTCEDNGRESPLYFYLDKSLDVVKGMADNGFTVFPMRKEDGDFLEKLSGEDHVIRLSYVRKNEDGKVNPVSGPLTKCAGQIERYQFKKRYAMVRCRLWGKDQAMVLGIMLREDREQRLFNQGSAHFKELFFNEKGYGSKL